MGPDFLSCFEVIQTFKQEPKQFSVSTFTGTDERAVITLSQELVHRALDLPKVQHAWGKALSTSKEKQVILKTVKATGRPKWEETRDPHLAVGQ